ncbi:hypothetical protein PHMEG_000853 [Phytophthora megakarya]|uniref:Uncharacterized protein n=1 Tax=Phytophthora megakarya TaxID=4795 RepID=A0A225X4J2_9STRA|nr:hypothetical protein PHMEG_000853 [Phytophthora megakarya]
MPRDTRNSRYWRSFLRDLLCPSTSYDEVCVFSLSGRVEYRYQASSRDSLDVDPVQILALFHQLTRQAIQEENKRHQPLTQSTLSLAPALRLGGLTPALRLGGCVFHVVSASFSSICAVSSGRTRGLVVEKLPFGVLVVAFSTPLQLETVFSHVDRACAALRC